MRLCDIKPDKGLLKKRKRVGRGDRSGHGKTSGRGTKGQLSRAGGNTRLGFEGGQMPLHRRIPHLRGFKNTRKKEFNIINVSALNRFDDESIIDFSFLIKRGLIMKENSPLKILGNGSVDKKFTVKANFFSESAARKIKDAGGNIEVLQIGKTNNKKAKKKQ